MHFHVTRRDTTLEEMKQVEPKWLQCVFLALRGSHEQYFNGRL